MPRCEQGGEAGWGLGGGGGAGQWCGGMACVQGQSQGLQDHAYYLEWQKRTAEERNYDERLPNRLLGLTV